MRIGLFIPCYVDQFYPQIGMATVDVLKSFEGVEVDFPYDQTCCGQPMANTGCVDDTRPLAEKFVQLFHEYDHIVSPSGSCVSMVKNHYVSLFQNDARFEKVKANIWEFSEFLIDVLQVKTLANPFPHKVGLHSSCHGLRELRLDSCSERMGDQGSKVRRLLEMVPEIELVELQRPDECCGFGGTFAVAEEGVSLMMGSDRIQDHLDANAEIMTATDASCLMHLEGIIKRRKLPISTMHITEIIAGRSVPCH